MKIEKLVPRKANPPVQMGDALYQFVPNAQGRFIADVTNEHHAARFLSIPEGYRFFKESEGDHVPENVRLLAGNVVLDPEIVERIEGELGVAKGVIEKLQGDLTSMRERLLAVEAENDTLKRRIELADDALDGQPATTATNTPDNPTVADEPEKPTEAKAAGKSERRLELEAKFKDKFGRRPDKRISDEKIVEMIEE